MSFNQKSEADYYNEGSLAARQGDFHAAIANYSKALELNPRFAEAYVGRGVVMTQMGKFEQAIADLTNAISLKPDQAMFYRNRVNTS